MQASDFNLNLQRYVIAETDPVTLEETLSTIYHYPTEAAAQGYINTFGGERILRVAHLVKVRDNKRGNVPEDKPVLWAVQDNGPGGTKVLYGNLHVSKSTADFWVSLFGPPKATKLMTEYIID